MVKAMDFRRIAVIGPGLLGGSLVRAIGKRRDRTAGEAIEVRVWGRRREPVAALEAEGIAAIASIELEEVTRGADLVILATPVGVMGDRTREMIEAGALAPGAIVTDVGSVKASVVAELEPLVTGAGGCFVGSHPMAGSEKTGLEHASADLFVGAACLVTPTAATPEEAMERVEAFWQWLGGRIARLSPGEHDRAVAMVSHLPHLVAALLVESVLGKSPELGAFAGGGFRDSTRIASGAAEMWTEILSENREAVREALAHFHHLTGESLAFLDDLKNEELHRLLAEAKQRRDDLPLPAGSDPEIPS